MKKVCVVTGTRAEYGLLKPIIGLIEKDDNLKLQLIATGAHLSPEFGLTYRQIEEDGFSIDEKVEMLLSSDTSSAVTKSCGIEMIGMADALSRLQPDMMVLLGDRYEAFMATIVARIARIPIAHLHGGELTRGAIDDAMRHSITKFSHLHFTSTEKYRKRVIQLGENPEDVYNVGAIGVENLKKLKLLSKEELENDIGFKFGGKAVIVTFHPVTLEKETAREQFDNLLKAIDKVPDMKIIFTKANADTDGRIINQMIDAYVRENGHKCIAFTSMGQLRYFSAVKYCDAVIGNSSSGIIEVPSFFKPTVNIGSRQDGREKSDSVIDCDNSILGISSAIDKAFSKEFLSIISASKNPYEGKDTSERIVKIIRDTLEKGISVVKDFYDLP